MGFDHDRGNTAIEGVYLSFSPELSVRPETHLIELNSTTSSICDSEGNLQFYTNGCKVANWRHELMENGDGINPGPIHEQYCIDERYPWRGIYIAGHESAISLPSPGSGDSLYYLFHKGREKINGESYNGPLYYTLINMAGNEGTGKVEEKNVVIVDEDLHFGQLTAVKHADGVRWWVFTPDREGTNRYYRFLLDEEGVSNAEIQAIGIETTQTGGWANFSPDGAKYARYAPRIDDLFLFDFNRETGELSNFQQIIIEEEDEWWSGVAFSPNSRFLYVSSYDYIYQFDTWADDIASSRITIAEYQYTGEVIEQNPWGMQLGPDCKLYVYCNSCDVIHVIHNPDEPGLACNFEQGAVQLPWPIFRSQPHFPNYRLGPVGDEGLPCTPVVSVTETVLPEAGVRLWPNPAGEYVFVGLRASGFDSAQPSPLSPRRSPLTHEAERGLSGVEVQVLDTYGRFIPNIPTTYEGEGRWALRVGHLPAGLYYVQVRTEDRLEVVKFVKE
jgi:hypothetical protein